MPDLRPMRQDDVAAVNELSVRAFEDYARRRGESTGQRPPAEAAHVRLRHLIATDPRGCCVAEVEWITARQGWALDVAVAARLDLQPYGAVFVPGAVGRLAPYLPSGAYL